MDTTSADTLPQHLRAASWASNAELIQRMMAADELDPADTYPHAEHVRSRAAAAQAEMDKRKAEGLA